MADGTQAQAPAATETMSLDQHVDALLAGLQGPEDEQQQQPKPAQPPEPKPGEEELPPAAAEPASDLIEWDGEDGKPVQIKLQDAIAAYTERGTLARQVEELQQAKAALPQELEQALLQTSQERQRLIAQAQQLQQFYQPQPPNRALLDKTSPHYDPDSYANQLADFEAGQRWLGELQQRSEQEQKKVEFEQAELRKAAIARGRQQLKSIWPEAISDKPQEREAAFKDIADVMSTAGFDAARDLATVTDPRIYHILKLAVAGLKAQAQASSTIKKVVSTPRLVRSAGRTQQPAQRNGAALAKLQKTGSIDDAIDFLLGG